MGKHVENNAKYDDARQFIVSFAKYFVRFAKAALFVVFVIIFLPVCFIAYIFKELSNGIYRVLEIFAGKPLRKFVRWASK